MSVQLQMQVVCRKENVSLPYGRSLYLPRRSSSPFSNLSFHSSSTIPLNQLLQLSHKSNSTAFTPKIASPALQIAAAYSLDRDYVAESPAKTLRRILETPGTHQGPVCFDALSAKLVEKAGFSYCFTGGFQTAARLGLPDCDLVSYGEMVDQGRKITEAVSIPVIGDADDGFGNAMNLKRTIKGYIKAGYAGIMLDDQVSLKPCGQTKDKKVVSREEAVMRIKAAIDARKESASDIVIVGRTDARQAVSFDEALWRTRAFADAGADVIFLDCLYSKEEMKAFCDSIPLVPKLAAHMLEGGEKPFPNSLELGNFGYKLVAYPFSLLGVSIQAMQDALFAIRGGRIPPLGSMPSFEKMKEILGFNSYYEEEKRYAIRASPLSSQIEQSYQSPQYPITTNTYSGANGASPSSRVLSRKLRIKVTGRDGYEKINTRVPAGYLEGIINIVPALGGVNIKALVEEAADAVGEKLLVDFFDVTGDRIQVFLE